MLGFGSSLENLGLAILAGALGVLLVLSNTMSFFRGSQFPVDGKVGANKTPRSWNLTDFDITKDCRNYRRITRNGQRSSKNPQQKRCQRDPGGSRCPKARSCRRLHIRMPFGTPRYVVPET